jgi:hypothetical protein
MTRDGPRKTESRKRGESWSARQILALFIGENSKKKSHIEAEPDEWIERDLGMEVSERDIHIKKLCGNEWLCNYRWCITHSSGFHSPKQDLDHWSRQDKLKVVRAYKRNYFRAVMFRY